MDKKQIQEEEITRLENQIKGYEERKENKIVNHEKTIEKEDNEIEILQMRLDAMKGLKIK